MALQLRSTKGKNLLDSAWQGGDHLPFVRIRSLLNIMQEFKPERLSVLTMLLQGTADALRMGAKVVALGGRDNKTVRKALLAEFYTAIASFHGTCSDVGLATSARTIEKITELGLTDPGNEKALSALADKLQGRLHDELEIVSFFSLSAREATYYAKPREGWEQIIQRFPSAVDDVEEARKCLALSRYAAAVFHSVQVVEVGLIELGKFIGVNDPISGWTAVGKRLKKVIDTNYKDRTQFEKDSFAFLEQVHGTTEALKNAWRNKVSHAHGRLILMTATFSPEIAEEILFASRSFMRRLVDGLPWPAPAGEP